MKILAVYPGRFQPFHKGHAQVYHWLQNKFGEAVIATSDKVEAPKSPFNFSEKKKMMMLAGVPSSDIKQVTNPYIAKEILKNYDPKKTILVFAVSQKDMEEDPRFSFKPTKSGNPSYLQPYKGNENKLKPFGDPLAPKGYVVVTPTFTFDVLGKPATSASELRKQFVSLNDEKQKAFIKDLFGKYDASIHKLMNDKIGAMIKNHKPKSLKSLKEDITRKHFGPMMDSFVSFASDKLGLKYLPTLKYKDDEQGEQPSFGGYNPSTNELTIVSKNRHPMDVFRTVAHELVHHKQNCDGKLGKDISQEGSTGSDIENEANAEAGKIMRWFAKANPGHFNLSYVVEEVINEGINDPSILKVVFLAGGPGSGKDFVMKQTMDGMGFTEINSDNALEYLMKKQGLDLKMPEHEKKQRDVVRGRAKNLTKEKQRLALSGRNGIIINGTADDPEKIFLIRKELESMGYDSMMVFVNTSNEISKERNFMRGVSGGRKVPDGTDKYGNPNGSEDIRSSKWKAAQDARPFFMKLFGKETFIEFDNSDDVRKVDVIKKQEIENTLQDIWKNIKAFSVAPHKNEAGTNWIQNEMEKRQIRKLARAKAYAYGNPNAQVQPPQSVPPQHMIPSQNDVPNQNQLSQAQMMGLTYYGFGRYGKEIEGRHVVTHISMNGQLVAKPVNRTSPITQTPRGVPAAPATQMAEEKKMKGPDPCWKGYEMIGKKKKNGRKVPNCVPVKEENIDDDFIKFMSDPKNREFGTDKLAKLYKKMTPGQELKQEDNNTSRLNLPVSNGIGPTYAISIVPGLITGYANLAESIQKWMNNPNTQKKFIEKYGDLAEQKLIETARKLNVIDSKNTGPKSFDSIREAWSAASYGKDPTDKSGFYSGRGGVNGDVEEQSVMGSYMPNPSKSMIGKEKEPRSRKRISESTPAWQRKEGKNPEGGLNKKGIESYRRENPGSKLSLAVTTPPAKLKKGSKRWKRRKSFCARMSGVKGPMKDEKGLPTRKALSLRKWNCEE